MKIFLLLLIALVYQTALSQTKKLDVLLFGKSIGQTTISKQSDNNGLITYHLNSNSSVNAIIKTRNSNMEFDIKYLNGSLYSAFCKAINDGVQAITNISKTAEGYLIKKENEVKKVTEAVTFSSMELYFTEPVHEKRVFSERMGEFVTFEKTAPGEYVNKLKDVTNIYRYRNGSLYEIEMRKPLGSVFMRAKN